MLSLCSVGVYLDSNTCFYHFDNLKDYTYNFDPNNFYIEPNTLPAFLVSNQPVKFTTFHVPFTNETTWLERLHQTLKVSNLVFVFCSELHQHTVNQLISLDLPNITIFTCGFINYEFKYAKIRTWMDWFITTIYFYNSVRPNLLNEKLNLGTKPKYFDILLGCERPHRNYVYDYINNNNLNSKVIMTYYRRWNIDLRETDHIFEVEGLEFLPESNYNHSVHQVSYYGHRMNLSQVIPFSIYNDSYYSVVAETNAVNQFNFYTEKIVKPILGRRLFVAVAGSGYLRNLRSFGFQTFGDVIDESYDDELDDYQRWGMAMDQVRYLTTQDPIEIYDKIKGVVEHNQHLMLTNDWYGDFIKRLKKEIDSYLTTAHIDGD